MRRILIIGAGQAGLLLALSLAKRNYDVTVMSAETPEELTNGWVRSTQCMFGPALQIERDEDVNLWEEQAPKVQGLGLTIAGPDGSPAIDWRTPIDAYAQSVDQRMKMAGWLELLEQRGGRVEYRGATTGDVAGLCEDFELVIVAAGKGDLVGMFDVDKDRSVFRAPQRKLAAAYVHGLAPRADATDFTGVYLNAIPTVGELLMIPALTLSGPCDILFFEGIPGGPLDCCDDRPGPEEQLRRMLGQMAEYLPWEYERCRNIELTDGKATLAGGYTPVVRHPVSKLDNGTIALGMADVVVANDPITGQGSNNAAHCARIYLQSIEDHGDRPFDAEWMHATFDRYWAYVEPVTRWTNAMLMPPPPHVQQLLGAAGHYPEIAKRFAQGFINPADFEHWFMTPDAAERYLAEVVGNSTTP